jgi:hypothetical protein
VELTPVNKLFPSSNSYLQLYKLCNHVQTGRNGTHIPEHMTVSLSNVAAWLLTSFTIVRRFLPFLCDRYKFTDVRVPKDVGIDRKRQIDKTFSH